MFGLVMQCLQLQGIYRNTWEESNNNALVMCLIRSYTSSYLLLSSTTTLQYIMFLIFVFVTIFNDLINFSTSIRVHRYTERPIYRVNLASAKECQYQQITITLSFLFLKSIIQPVVLFIVQDLSKLGRDLHNVVIIDNSPASYIFHPENAVSEIFVDFLFCLIICCCSRQSFVGSKEIQKN